LGVSKAMFGHELTLPLEWGCLDVHSVVNIIARRAPGTHVVITGLYAPPTLVEAADIVTEMRMISIRPTNRVWDLKLASSGSRGQA
jgi:ATP:corrinoid adenosyltransferase